MRKDWKEKAVMFAWQHLLLIISLFIMTLGVALCVRSDLGSSVISTIPFVMSIAGESGKAPAMTIGEYTYCMNFLLVGLQVLVLRKKFEPVQLFQLLIGFFFGFLLDINMWLTARLVCETFIVKLAVQLGGCLILAIGILFEIRCGSVTMPGEGFPVALSRAFGIPFSKAKIGVDISLVAIAVALGFAYFGTWLWNVVGIGTLLAMVLVGTLVRLLEPHMAWFGHLVCYRPGFRRYIYGLARFIYPRK
ncbi:MAG: hypothetical protein K2N16_10195 [Muribaculaceae bacterium]|nr:hypothetical protein [Muribaculaceae bacterium]